MTEENISQQFWLKNKDETRNNLIEELNWNELMSKKHREVCTTLNYIEHFTSYFRFYNYWMFFHFLFCFFIWYSNNSAIGLKICAITVAIKK